MSEPGESGKDVGPWKKHLPVTVGHKNETLPKILVNVLIACRGGFRTKSALCTFPEVLSQHSFDTALLMADVSPQLAD